jgi:hypothetical protein
MSTARKVWEAHYVDDDAPARNVLSTRYAPAATYREAQAEANRSRRAVRVAPRGEEWRGRVFEPKREEDTPNND